MIIYKITNKANGKAYIGQTSSSLEVRWRHHVKYNKFILGKAIKKYGIESFLVEELAKADTREDLNNLENKLIVEHNTLSPSGYNLNTGGNINTPSEETRSRMSESLKGEKNPFYGKTHSLETRKRLSEVASKRNVSEETREKHRKQKSNMLGRKGKDSPFWGRKHTEETKAKMRLKAIERQKLIH